MRERGSLFVSTIVISEAGETAATLQWLDDLEDWREDLALGDENLLFLLLENAGYDLASHPHGETLVADVKFALVEAGVLSQAYEAARAHIAEARCFQQSLVFGAIAPELDKLAAQIPAAARRVRRRIQFETAEALLGVFRNGRK